MNTRYKKLGELLGEGSYKTVTKAIDEEEGKEVAYNEVRIKRYEEETHAGNSFSKEIALLKHISHPNIIQILDYWFTSDDRFVFVTEMMTGGTVKDYISKVGPLNCKLIRKWAQQILEGLMYLHTRDPPIIHRDIKNENIFVNSSQGEIKIGDLGIARERKHKRYTIVGTPNFMAREMFEGEGYSEKVDIYAFGMCLIEMATGCMPYAELSESNEVYRSVLQGVLPQAIHGVGNACLRSLIMNCLAAQPNRFSAKQCLSHHFFDAKMSCPGDCLPQDCATILPLAGTSGGMELSLISFKDHVLTFQLALSGSLRFIKFDYDLNCDTLSKVSAELVAERIIDGAALECFKELLERGISKALEKRDMGHIKNGIIELDIKETGSLGEKIILKRSEEHAGCEHPHKQEHREMPILEKVVGSKFEFGEKTLEVMKEIDEEMRLVQQRKELLGKLEGLEKTEEKECIDSTVHNAKHDSTTQSSKSDSTAQNLRNEDTDKNDAASAQHSIIDPQEMPEKATEDENNAAYYTACLQKYKTNCPLSQFVLDAAVITGRTEETAKSWLKSLRDESLETVFDLKLLAYEDWGRLPLTVFSCRVMQNMIYGINNTPLKEKQLPMNPSMPEYENRMSIHEFLVNVCEIIGRSEIAHAWENKLMAQDVRTVGELKSLHQDDWARLGLSVFGYRILQNVIFQKGRIFID